MGLPSEDPDPQMAFRYSIDSFLSPTSSDSLMGQVNKTLIEIIIPDHEWKFVYRVPTDTLVRELLRRIFTTCRLDVVEYANYGLYMPPQGVQKGKFLQEERPLCEYPQLMPPLGTASENKQSNGEPGCQNCTEPSGTLKLIKKCRYVDGIPMSTHKFRYINSKSHQKQFLSAIQERNIRRMDDMLDRGLDPNYQYSSTGETPLCCATLQPFSKDLILKLVEKGALLEFRDDDGFTPLHRAAICGNLESIKVLLDLGMNPNVRDSKSLTPLYHAVSRDIPTKCIALLLYDHAILGIVDDKNRQEVHQACLFDKPGHLEQLIIYGADLDAQTSNLDTALHICALNNHETCLRLLLKHGATRDMVNASGQTPSEVALLTGLRKLAELIDNFPEEEIVRTSRTPIYNTDRRPTAGGPRAALEAHRARHNFGDLPNSLDRLSSLGLSPNPRSRNPMSNFTRSMGSVVVRYADGSVLNLNNGGQHSSHTENGNNRARTRQITLFRGNSGFGFQIRGPRDSLDGRRSTSVPANQYIDEIFPNTPAARAGLKAGDYLLEVNGENVRDACHQHVASLIAGSGPRVTLKVVSGATNGAPPRRRIQVIDRRQSNYVRPQHSTEVRRSSSHDQACIAANCPPIILSLSRRCEYRKPSPANADYEGLSSMNTGDYSPTLTREICIRTLTRSRNSSSSSVNSLTDAESDVSFSNGQASSSASTKEDFLFTPYVKLLRENNTTPLSKVTISREMDENTISHPRITDKIRFASGSLDEEVPLYEFVDFTSTAEQPDAPTE
ncbi:hypothetical protein CRM22_009167 [Opisthorchis felineus]|uniref:PDZ domain-containing protein n=1 Tax=Opisthorchis felineus TaxID=147828 RepID=A0A4S2L8I6_OPIFE|nr:hypothetical protein CRM22_009167 [Opisthorchis felineus]TGZ59275.1 hypothetical protein CRM22_009167 [Opisthorchis felineus]TGZ59276.1 hypothetical protein CRM22_009167 [Opisthorchis felineus]